MGTYKRTLLYLALLLSITATLLGQVRSQVIQGEEIETFLRTAKVVQAKGVPKGIALPQKLTLELNGVTRFGAFKTIDESKAVMKFDTGGSEYNFHDSWRDEIVAYEVDKLIGLGMVPATVERSYAGKKGSLQFWVDSMMDEEKRWKENIQPPNAIRWEEWVQKVRLMDNLIYNVDRNLGNLLITKDWELVLIDHSRSFRLWNQLKDPKQMVRFSRSVLEGLQRLNEANLKEKTGKYLSKDQIKSLLKRRDLILELSGKMAAEKGESAVFYP